MIDGVSGVDLLASIMVFDPTAQPGKSEALDPASRPERRAAAPRRDLQRRATLPFALARAGQEVVSRPRRTVSVVRDAVEGIAQAIAAGLRPGLADAAQPRHRSAPPLRLDALSTSTP